MKLYKCMRLGYKKIESTYIRDDILRQKNKSKLCNSYIIDMEGPAKFRKLKEFQYNPPFCRTREGGGDLEDWY